MSDSQNKVLFCPFCRECFEEEERCPHHDLSLVSFRELPRPTDREPYGADEPVPLWEWRLGRGWLWLGGALMLVAFFLPVFTMTVGDATIRETPATIVLGGQAALLWSIPIVALILGYLPFWRRTPHSMHKLRVAVPLLALFPVPAVAYSTVLAYRATALMPETATVGLDYGAVLVVTAAFVGAVGGFRFGQQPRRDDLDS